MYVDVVIQQEVSVNIRGTCRITEEVILENPNLNEDELIEKIYKELIYENFEDHGIKLISITENDEDKIKYWIRENIREIKYGEHKPPLRIKRKRY